MKAFLLIGVTLACTVFVNAFVDYHLKCSKNELSIRWPSYHSSSEYYVCQREGGNQVTLTCNPGEVFTYVLQMCTSPAKFIPPPPMEKLPHPQFNQISSVDVLHISGIDNSPPLYTPIITQEHLLPNLEMPSSMYLPNKDKSEQIDNTIESEDEILVNFKPIVPGKPILPSVAKPNVPLPPTPAPTPPVVKPTPPAKKPVPISTTEKKKPPIPQSAPKKPSSSKTNQKKQPTIPKSVKKLDLQTA